jgi:pimeloyl-ACP methyl ester carboxylesterase
MTGPLPPSAAARDGAIVLVHGAWVGEWCWDPIDPLLRTAGRRVVAVSLTGHGSRRHQGGPHVSLATHVDDVMAVLETHDLTHVTLVGHSYGGRVVTQVATRAAARIRSTVFVDAHAPNGPDPGVPATWRELAAANGGMVPFTGYDPDPVDVGGDEGVAWFLARTAPLSLACFLEPWQVELPPHVRKTYVYATANQPSRFEGYARECRDDPGWAYHEIGGPHFLMISHAAELAAIVLDA